MNDQQASVLKTHLKKSWVTKMVVFFVALVGLGIWGYVDAVSVYPARGQKHADFALLTYLDDARLEGQLFRASVSDPAAEYERLAALEPTQMTTVEQSRLTWLTSLSRIHDLQELTAENQANPNSDTETQFIEPMEKLQSLATRLANENQPKPLTSYDIMVQWIICYAGFAGALWVLFLLAKAKAQTFKYEPATHRLTLPNGKSFTPEQIHVVDKRKWDKFFVFLKVDGIPGEVKLDLLKFVPLEEWILEMEKLSPNYEPEEETPGEGGGDAPSDEAESNADEATTASAQ